jgi:N-acetylmuramoyl-L-alanine amidase CwlA
MVQKVDSSILKYEFIGYNPHSRPTWKLINVRKLVIHYTANPGASARNHKNYFANLSDRSASAHIFVDSKEAICILPLDEVAFHANEKKCRIPELKGNIRKPNGEIYYGDANVTTIGIELCIEKDGEFHEDTLKNSAQVFADLCKAFKLDPIEDIVRHNDITGKNCPAPFVENTKDYNDFKKSVKALITPKQTETAEVYRVRKSWEDVASQIGAYKDLEGARELADEKAKEGYEVYNKDGKVVYTPKVVAEKPAPAPVKPQPVEPKPKPIPVKPQPKPAPKPKVTLPKGVFKKGDKGNAVKQIQEALNDLNFKCGKVDGVYGEDTVDAIKRFQSMYVSPADGVYGDRTRVKMEQLLNK